MMENRNIEQVGMSRNGRTRWWHKTDINCRAMLCLSGRAAAAGVVAMLMSTWCWSITSVFSRPLHVLPPNLMNYVITYRHAADFHARWLLMHSTIDSTPRMHSLAPCYYNGVIKMSNAASRRVTLRTTALGLWLSHIGLQRTQSGLLLLYGTGGYCNFFIKSELC